MDKILFVALARFDTRYLVPPASRHRSAENLPKRRVIDISFSKDKGRDRPSKPITQIISQHTFFDTAPLHFHR